MIDFEKALADVRRKQSAAQRAVSELFRDGKPMFAPEVHAEQMTRALAPLQQAVAAVEQMAQDTEAEAKKLETLASRDPLAGLSTDDLQRAAALAPFIKEEVEGMNAYALAQRLQAVADHEDVVSKHLYLRYASQRTDALENTGRPLAAIRTTLTDPKTAQAAQQANELRQQASKAVFDARQMLGETDGSAQAALERRRAEYSL
jgi:hypothetical protein